MSDKSQLVIKRKITINSIENDDISKKGYTKGFNSESNSINYSKVKSGFKKIYNKKNELNKRLIRLNYKIIIIYLIFLSLFIETNQRNLQSKFSIISLKTYGTGNIKLFNPNNNNNNNPNQMLINDINKTVYKIYYFNDLEGNENNVTLIWNEDPVITSQMFANCPNIIEIDLTNFNISNLENMANMFRNCSALRKINFPNLPASKITTMGSSFKGCSSLISLDLSYFNTELVTSVTELFSGCSSLTSLDLSNFYTPNLQTMHSMFEGCSNLTFLNISNLVTTLVTRMDKLFYGCSNLTSLDLSSFNTSKVKNMDGMFYGCEKLEYINLKIAMLNENMTSNSIFYLLPENLTFCTQHEEWEKFFTERKYIYCREYNPYNDKGNEIKCYINNSVIISNNNFTCDICGNNYFRKYNDSKDDDNSFLNCYNFIEGYYLDESDFLYKSCYESCKTCKASGNEENHNCIVCDDDYKDEIIILNHKNCYKIPSSNLKSDSIKNFYFSDLWETNTLSNSYNTEETYHMNSYTSELIIITTIINPYSSQQTVIDTNFNSFTSELAVSSIINKSNSPGIITSQKLDNSEYSELSNEIIQTDIIFNNITNLNEAESEIIIDKKNASNNFNKTIQILIDELFNELNLTEIDNGIDKKIIEKNLVIVLTSTLNQKINEDENNITMDLGQCEDILKNDYNLSDNDSLYILQIISEEIGMKIPKVEYEVYYPLYN